jgi:chromosome segregation ATPase
MDGSTPETTTFRTPQRILIPKLLTSRAGWKAKAGERKRQLKAARIRSRDLETSRTRWRERATAAEQQVADLRSQLQQAQQQLAETQAAAEHLGDGVKKN